MFVMRGKQLLKGKMTFHPGFEDEIAFRVPLIPERHFARILLDEPEASAEDNEKQPKQQQPSRNILAVHLAIETKSGERITLAIRQDT